MLENKDPSILNKKLRKAISEDFDNFFYTMLAKYSRFKCTELDTEGLRSMCEDATQSYIDDLVKVIESANSEYSNDAAWFNDNYLVILKQLPKKPQMNRIICEIDNILFKYDPNNESNMSLYDQYMLASDCDKHRLEDLVRWGINH